MIPSGRHSARNSLFNQFLKELPLRNRVFCDTMGENPCQVIRLRKYFLIFLISMVPLIELRGAVPIAAGMGLPYIPSLIVCVVGNLIPVPIVYFFARKVLVWGVDKPYIGKLCSLFLTKGERAGQKLVAKTGRYGLFMALLLFVGIPLPGTGAWTGTLAASFLNMGFKSTVLSVSLGVILAGCIMALTSAGVFHIFGL